MWRNKVLKDRKKLLNKKNKIWKTKKKEEKHDLWMVSIIVIVTYLFSDNISIEIVEKYS